MGISVVGVVGAGFMGSGIAESAARAGKHVVLYEQDDQALERSRGGLARAMGDAVGKGRLTVEEADRVVERILYTDQFGDLAGADAVVEAVTEDVKVKRDLFARLDEELPDARFLASNTSSIPIAQLASGLWRPERILGLHFFSPVPVMRLVEVVAAIETSDAVLTCAEEFAAEIGKHSIRTKDRSGFVVNMLLIPYLVSAVRMYEEGFASPEDIDDGMKLGCGHPMGPLTLCDFIGLDVIHAICESLYEEFRRPEFAPPPLLRRMVQAGHYGRKTGRGFYEYQTKVAA